MTLRELAEAVEQEARRAERLNEPAALSYETTAMVVSALRQAMLQIETLEMEVRLLHDERQWGDEG